MTPNRAAQSAVNRAVARKELPRAAHLTCVDCGGCASDYDHRDYSKPLEVEPVCRPCNAARGRAANATPADQSQTPLGRWFATQPRGSKQRLAELLDVSPVMVTQWCGGVKQIAVENMARIEGFTGGAVTRRELRPDDWHLIWPEAAHV